LTLINLLSDKDRQQVCGCDYRGKPLISVVDYFFVPGGDVDAEIIDPWKKISNGSNMDAVKSAVRIMAVSPWLNIGEILEAIVAAMKKGEAASSESGEICGIENRMAIGRYLRSIWCCLKSVQLHKSHTRSGTV